MLDLRDALLSISLISDDAPIAGRADFMVASAGLCTWQVKNLDGVSGHCAEENCYFFDGG